MPRLKKLMQLAANPVLISVHPSFAVGIAEGRKRVEFRRRWPRIETDVAVIYATSPVKSIVAVVQIDEVVRAGNAKLWELSKSYGGSVTRATLRDYMSGLEQGVALLLGQRFCPNHRHSPKDMFGDSFVAPQSFRYLHAEEIDAVIECFGRVNDFPRWCTRSRQVVNVL